MKVFRGTHPTLLRRRAVDVWRISRINLVTNPPELTRGKFAIVAWRGPRELCARFNLIHLPRFFSSFSLRSSLEWSDTPVYEPQIRTLLGTDSHFCEVVVLEARTGAIPRYVDTHFGEAGSLKGISLRMSTPPQNCQLNISIRNSEQ